MAMTVETKRPLISVVTATYNALEGLKTTVESVASQTIASVEHIVVDGGSNDGTCEYLESLGGMVRWVSEPDEGIADAMNKGIALATGDWILVLHAEDTFRDGGSLARIAQDLGDFDIASYHVLKTDDKAEIVAPTKGFSLLFMFFMTVPHQGIIARSYLFEKVGGYDHAWTISMDYDWLWRARRKGTSLVTFDRYETIMPATGISSRLDRNALMVRLEENRKIQAKYKRTITEKLAHALFWMIYPLYKLPPR